MPDNLRRVDAETRAHTVSDVHYRVHLTVGDDPAVKTFKNDTEISFTWSGGSHPTFVNFAAAGPGSVRAELNGMLLPADAYDHETGEIHFTPNQSGHNVLHVVADCAYSATGVGLHRTVDAADGKMYLYTHAEPFDAHKFYPCFDQPDIKATFDTTLTGPARWILASLTQAASRTRDGDTATVTFPTTERISTYLNAFAAGDYVVRTDTYRGLPVVLLSRKSLEKELDKQSDQIFDITKRAIAFYEDRFGIRFPYPVLQLAFVPEFNMGAMENPGLITINDAICLWRGPVSAVTKSYLVDVIPHEIAHYWFGDLVTMKWWDDLWLNESFATVMSLLCSKALNDDSQSIDFAIGRKVGALAADQLSTTHPVEADVPDIESMLLNFDPLTYGKGASILRQLVALIGEEAFYSAVRQHLEAHKGGNATRADFFAALHAARPDLNLQRWEHDWLATTGVSKLSIDVNLSGQKLTSIAVVQDSDVMRQHHVRIGFYDWKHGKLVRRGDGIEVDIDEPRTEIPQLQGQRRPALVVVNDGDLTYAKVRFDRHSWVTLRNHLGEIEDPLTRAVCWNAAWDMCRDGDIAATDFIRMATSQLATEQNAVVVERVLGYMYAALTSYVDPSVEKQLRTQVANVAFKRLRSAPAGSDLQRAWLGGASATTRRQADVLQRFLDGAGDADAPGLELSPGNRWAIVMRLVSRGWVANPEVLIAAEHARDTTTSGNLSALAARASVGTAQAKAWAWAMLSDPNFTNLHEVRAVAGAFQQPGQEALTSPYTDGYAQLITDWQGREKNVANTLTGSLFPAKIDSSSVAIADASLRIPNLPASAVRLVTEAKDRVVRALHARAVDIGAHQGAGQQVA